jgi:hypothetical protein
VIPLFLFIVLLLGVFFRRFFFLTPDMIRDAAYARLTGAVGAAEKRFFRFNAMTDNPAPALGADRRQFVNRTLETIENVAVARRNNFKR